MNLILNIIGKAAEIVRRKFMKVKKIDKTKIETEKLQREEGPKNVSTMEIKLKS